MALFINNAYKKTREDKTKEKQLSYQQIWKELLNNFFIFC